MTSSSEKTLSLSQRLYALLLMAYPSEFRDEYGWEMAQVFRDCCRRERRRGGLSGIARLWARTLVDFTQTALKEHAQALLERASIMKILRTFVVAIVIYVVAVMIFGRVLVYLRPTLPYALGALIDSLISVGIVFNFFVLLFYKTGWMNAIKAVRVSTLVTSVALAVLLLLMSRVEPPNGVGLMAMVAALIFWFVVHTLWAMRKAPAHALT